MGTKWIRRSKLVLVALMIIGLFAGTVLAQDGAKKVGVIILFGDGSEHQQVVSVPADATALDVLNATGLEVVTTDFGGGDMALCSIGQDGCPAENCFCAEQSWAFWLPSEAGTDWEMAPVGLAGYVPADREVIGFSWTGWDENWNALSKPPIYFFEDLTASAGVPVPTLAVLVLLGCIVVGLVVYMSMRRRAGR